MLPPARRSRFFSPPSPLARGCGKQCAGYRPHGRSIPFPWMHRPITSSRMAYRSWLPPPRRRQRLSRAGRCLKLEPAHGRCRRRDQPRERILPPGKARPRPRRPAVVRMQIAYPAGHLSRSLPQPHERSGRAGPGVDLPGGQRASRPQVDHRDAGRKKRELPAARLVPSPACGPTHLAEHGRSYTAERGRTLAAERGRKKDQRPGRGQGGRQAPRRCLRRPPAGRKHRSAHRKSTYLSPVVGLRGARVGRAPGACPPAREGPEKPAGLDPIVPWVVLRDRPPRQRIVPTFRDARQGGHPPFGRKNGAVDRPVVGALVGLDQADFPVPARLCLQRQGLAAPRPPGLGHPPVQARTAVQSTNGRVLAAM